MQNRGYILGCCFRWREAYSQHRGWRRWGSDLPRYRQRLFHAPHLKHRGHQDKVNKQKNNPLFHYCGYISNSWDYYEYVVIFALYICTHQFVWPQYVKKLSSKDVVVKLQHISIALRGELGMLNAFTHFTQFFTIPFDHQQTTSTPYP